MEGFNSESFAAILALVGLVIIVAALLSGLIERSNLPQVAVFLALGAVLGPAGLGLVNVTLDSPALRVVATLSLALVLFTDALTLNIAEIRRLAGLAARVLGPGTLLSAGLIALAGWALLGLPPAAAAILGAALASTDPVLLRGLLQRRDLSSTARQALRLESGLNDVVLLPIVLIAMVFLTPGATPTMDTMGHMALSLFLLGPGAGVAVGLLAVATLDLVRRRLTVRRDYESLYSLGVAFAAFAAAESVHGSGFLAVFAAGMTIAALDVELCDCFLEYGETTAELALLFTFVLFGSSLIWSGFGVLTGATALFAVLVLLARPVAFLLSLLRTQLDRRGRLLIAWFGPRGLSTLLLVLLPVFAGVPGSATLFAICCLVVLLSVTVHGGSLMVLGGDKRRVPAAAPATLAAATSAPAAPTVLDGAAADAPVVPPAPPADGVPEPVGAALPAPADGEALTFAANGAVSRPFADPERLTVAELKQLQMMGAPVVVLDVRTDRTLDSSELQAQGALRLHPDYAVEEARRLALPKQAWLVAFCA